MSSYVAIGETSAPFEPLPSSSTGQTAGPTSFNSSAFVSERGTERINKYETRLPIRLDMLAALTYSLGCVSGIFFLIFETKNDYVRFHAWQSSLYFLGLLTLQFLCSTFSKTLVWLVFVTELLSILFLGFQAYSNSDTLNRFMIPYVGEV